MKAQAKDAEYESALRSARQDLIKEQEESRKSWRAAQSAQVESARAKAQLAVKSGKEQISSETAMARASLVEQTEALANQIASAVLRKTA